jgi:mRNA interferase RelE/StbE
MYRVLYTRQARRAFQRLPRNTAVLIRGKLDRIALDPYAKYGSVTKLQNRPGFRLRVGDWSVIYEINGDKLIILVLRIGSRGGVYR